MQRAIDEDRVIAGDGQPRALRQGPGEVCDGGFHPLRDAERVGLGLAQDAEADALHAVGAQGRGAVVGAEHDGGDVAQPDVVAQQDVLEVFRRRQIGGGAHDDVLGAGFQRTGRHVERRRGQRLRDIHDRQAAAGERALVDVDAEDLLLVTVEFHVGHSFHGRDAVGDLVVDEERQVFHAERGGGDGKPHDRLRIGIRLDDARFVDIVGKLVGDPAERIAHVVGGNGEIGGIVELEGDAAGAELRGGRDLAEAADAGDRALDDLGDLLVHGLGGGTVVIGAHGDDRLVDVRQFAHLDAEERGKAGDDEKRVEDRGQDRPAHEECGKGL